MLSCLKILMLPESDSVDDRLNWAGNFTYASTEIVRPANEEQVQELVRSRARVKALGTRHSFNGLADTAGCHISLAGLNRIAALDRANRTVTVEGGVRYGELGRYLYAQGFALHNLASLPHITVAGACASATHGSGPQHGNLATAVRSFELVKADGNKLAFSRDDAEQGFDGAVVGLGALGVITRLTLDVVPAFDVAQSVYEHLPLSRLEGTLDELYAGAYSVSLFTDWKEPAFNQVWVKRRVGDPEEGSDVACFGAKRANVKLHPVPGFAADNCSDQLGVPGPWHERLPHFRMDFTPSAGDELQSEYFVARSQAYEALCAVDAMRERIAPLLYITEVRAVAADRLWLSPNYARDSVGIHFTWKADWKAVRQVLPEIERRLEPFDARPHWSKLFTMEPDRLQPMYERLSDFRALARRCDPEGKFRNDYLNRYVLGE